MVTDNSNTFGCLILMARNDGFGPPVRTVCRITNIGALADSLRQAVETLTPHVTKQADRWVIPETLPQDLRQSMTTREALTADTLLKASVLWQLVTHADLCTPVGIQAVRAFYQMRYAQRLPLERLLSLSRRTYFSPVPRRPIIQPPQNINICNNIVEHCVMLANEYLAVAQNDLSQADSFISQAAALINKAATDTDPHQELVDANAAVTLLSQAFALQQDAQGQGAAAQVLLQGSSSFGCDLAPLVSLVNQVQQVADTANNDLVGWVETLLLGAASSYVQDASNKIIQQQNQQQECQKAAQAIAGCLQIVDQWYGVDLVFDETCTQQLEAALKKWLHTPSIWDFIGFLGAAIATGLATAGVGTLVTALVALVIATLKGEADLLQIDIGTQDMFRHNGITMHCSYMPLALDVGTAGLLTSAEDAAFIAQMVAEASGPTPSWWGTPFTAAFWITGN